MKNIEEKVLGLVLVLFIAFTGSFLLNLETQDYSNGGDGNTTIEVYYGYDYIGTSTKMPVDLHRCIETGDKHLYFVDSVDTTIIYKIANGSATVSTIANRDGIITAFWYDRNADYIYFCEYENDPGVSADVSLRYIDLSDNSINLVRGELIPPDWTDVPTIDCFVYSNTAYIRFVSYDDIEVPTESYIQIWTSATEYTSANMGDPSGRSFIMTPMVIIGAYAWFLWRWSDENPEIWKWEIGTANFTQMEDCGANTQIPSSLSQRALVYDGSDVIAFVLYDSSDTKYYLYTYVISTDTLTKGAEYNIALMLDRNNDPTSGTPNEYEKAYGTSSQIAYQFTRSYAHLVRIYDVSKNREHTATGNIQAITDNYIITTDKEIYKVMNIMPYIAKGNIYNKITEAPKCVLETIEKLATNQSIKIYNVT